MARGEDVMAAVGRLRAAARDGSLADLCRRRGVAVLAGFGSAVTGRTPAGAPQDVDVAVGWRRPPDDGGLTLIADLTKLADSGTVDVAFLDHADVVLVEEALATGEVWFEDRDGEAADRHLRASLVRMDTDWLRRLDLELMADSGGRPGGNA